MARARDLVVSPLAIERWEACWPRPVRPPSTRARGPTARGRARSRRRRRGSCADRPRRWSPPSPPSLRARCRLRRGSHARPRRLAACGAADDAAAMSGGVEVHRAGLQSPPAQTRACSAARPPSAGGRGTPCRPRRVAQVARGVDVARAAARPSPGRTRRRSPRRRRRHRRRALPTTCS